MCTNDLASKMNHWEISPNHYQTIINRRISTEEHFEKLFELFAGNVPADFEVNCNPNNLLAEANHYSIDLKAIKKLTKLCSLLRKNVVELKTVFKKSLRISSEYYTESERGILEPELRSLYEDVQRMMAILKGISGNSHEIREALKIYTENEDQYLRLLSLNKSAELRYQARITENGTNVDEFNLGMCKKICKWVRNCCPFICSTTQDNILKPELSDDITVDRGNLDHKSKEKLRKLCSILRINVIDLKNYHEIARRRISGFYYTESESIDLDMGLRSLKDNVDTLLDTLHNIRGYRNEIKYVFDLYTEYEVLYRALRSLNKEAILRFKAGQIKNDENKNNTI